MTMTLFDPADRFVSGTVGSAGSRSFYLQASRGALVLTVKVEKEQVAILCDRVNDVLDQVAALSAREPGEPGGSPEDSDPLQTPFDEDWRVQTIALSWDEQRACIVIECHDHDPDDMVQPGSSESPDVAGTAAANSMRVVMDPPTARAFARRGEALVSAGRPPCPFCGGPLDPQGHICPRANGYRR